MVFGYDDHAEWRWCWEDEPVCCGEQNQRGTSAGEKIFDEGTEKNISGNLEKRMQMHFVLSFSLFFLRFETVSTEKLLLETSEE